MQIVNRKSTIANRHGFYSELYTDEEIEHLARAFKNKRGAKKTPLEDEQKFLRIVILRLARGLFAPSQPPPFSDAARTQKDTSLLAENGGGDPQGRWGQRGSPLHFNKDDLTTFEKILSAIGHLAALERVRLAIEGGDRDDDDSIFDALAAMDHSKL